MPPTQPVYGHEDPDRDAAWLARVAAAPTSPDGQDALFALMSVYDRHFLVRLLHCGLDIDAAKAALTHCWEKVARRASKFDPARARAAAWLWLVLEGERLNALERQQLDRERLAFGDLEEGEGSRVDAGGALWNETSEPDLLRDRCVRKAMRQLHREDPEGARLLWERLALGSTPEELSQADGRALSTIKGILVRARRRARDLLQPCHEGRAQR